VPVTRWSAAVLAAALVVAGAAGAADARGKRSTAELRRTPTVHTRTAHSRKAPTRKAHTRTARTRAHPPKAPSYDQLVKRYKMAPASLGFLAVDADTGRVIAARTPDAPFIPASSIKVRTAVAALNILGGAYRFATRVYTRGSVKDGVLHGDVILRGGGDPMLATEGLNALIAGLKSKGIKSVDGRFLYDNTLFATQRAIEFNDDQELAYNPGVGPLSLNFNRVRLSWVFKGKHAARIRVLAKTDRTLVPVTFVGAALAPAGEVGHYGLIYDDDSSPPRWLLTRGARRRGEMWVPVRRPAVYTAEVFRRRAAEAGVTLPPPVAGKLPAEADLVATHEGKPLTTVLRKVLKYSNNMAAEMIGLVTANKLTGKPLGITPAAFALNDWYRKVLPKVNWSGLIMENQSGLTTRSRISARQLVAILRYARPQTYAGYRLIDLLRPYWIAARRVPHRMSVATVFGGSLRHKGRRRAGWVTLPGYVSVRAPSPAT
jgi:D-alanyl-D-alanine carboxypeptidase/D-alanyl-D-alanine-endopeptidase (penicillin-binding protein 4)